VRSRRRFVAVLAAALGAAVAVLPALAGSETVPSIEAENVGLYTHYWHPAQATVAPGGGVLFRNSTEVPHGVEWRDAVKPVCEEGAGKVPVGTTPSASATNWSGTCTFAQPGSYTFYCTVHGPEMQGTVTVSSGGATTLTTTTTGAPPPPTTTGAEPTSTPTAGGLLAAPLAQALKLASSQRGAVRGSIALSQSAAGSRLQVELLASRRALRLPGAARHVRVGRLLRAGLPAGVTRFAVALARPARRALRRSHRLALTVSVLLRAPDGRTASFKRQVVEHG
jgi:plastocyanin